MNKLFKNIAVEIIKENDGKNYFAIVPTLPGCFSQGRTVEETKKNVIEAIVLHLRALKKSGENLPDFETYQTTVQVSA
jgi:predicted RNase H-like HicB family nuclease